MSRETSSEPSGSGNGVKGGVKAIGKLWLLPEGSEAVAAGTIRTEDGTLERFRLVRFRKRYEDEADYVLYPREEGADGQ